MDESLFLKHVLQIKKQEKSKKEVLNCIEEITGILLNQEEIIVSKKNITIQTSSVKRSFLVQKKIQEKMKEKGYTVRL